MPSTARIVSLAAVSIALVSMCSVQAYAVPSSLNFDYRRRNLNVRIIEDISTHTIKPQYVESDPKLNKRDADFLSQMGLFNSYYKQVNTNGDNLRTYTHPKC